MTQFRTLTAVAVIAASLAVALPASAQRTGDGKFGGYSEDDLIRPENLRLRLRTGGSVGSATRQNVINRCLRIVQTPRGNETFVSRRCIEDLSAPAPTLRDFGGAKLIDAGLDV